MPDPTTTASPEVVKAAPAAKSATVGSLETLRKDIEVSRKQNQPLYTRVESWILGEGSKPGENKIDFSLWSNAATAEKDMQTICHQFPEFKTLYDSLTGSDKDKQQNFIQLLGEKLGEKVTLHQEKKKELAEFSKKEGSELIGDSIETGVKKIKKWFERGKPGDYVNIALTGACLYLAYEGVMTMWDGIKGQMGPGRGFMRNMVIGGGLTAGVFLVLKNVLEPKSAYAGEIPKDAEKIPNTDAEQKRINGIVETQGHARAFKGLTNAPMAEVLEAYRGRGDSGIKPKFLEKYSQFERYPDRGWFKEMVKQIQPKDLYEVTHSAFKIFENSYGYKEALKKNPTLTLIDYIQQEYVDKAREKNTTITFSEFTKDALRVSQEEKPEAAKKKAE